MLDITHVKSPIEVANCLPNGCHLDVDLYRHKQNILPRDNWATTSLVKDLPKPGPLKPIEFADLPLLLVHNQDNKIKVFGNIGCHRGVILFG